MNHRTRECLGTVITERAGQEARFRGSGGVEVRDHGTGYHAKVDAGVEGRGGLVGINALAAVAGVGIGRWERGAGGAGVVVAHFS